MGSLGSVLGRRIINICRRWVPYRGGSRFSSNLRAPPATWPAATAIILENPGPSRLGAAGTPIRSLARRSGARRRGCVFAAILMSAAMPLDLLEDYIAQHIAASPDEVIRFSWHGGEPTILGVDYYRQAVDIQRRLCPAGRTIPNGLQTNGTLLDEEWGRFLAAEGFAVGLSLDGPREVHDQYRLRRDGSSAFSETMRGYEILRRHGVPVDILCVVGSHNVRRPAEVYGFFKSIGATYRVLSPPRRAAARRAGRRQPRVRPAGCLGGFSLCGLRRVAGRGYRPDQGPGHRRGGPDGLRPGALALHLPAGLRRHPCSRAERGPLCLRPLRGSGVPAGQYPRDAARRAPRKPGPAGVWSGQAARRCPGSAWSATSGICATGNAPRTASCSPPTANRG